MYCGLSLHCSTPKTLTLSSCRWYTVAGVWPNSNRFNYCLLRLLQIAEIMPVLCAAATRYVCLMVYFAFFPQHFSVFLPRWHLDPYHISEDPNSLVFFYYKLLSFCEKAYDVQLLLFYFLLNFWSSTAKALRRNVSKSFMQLFVLLDKSIHCMQCLIPSASVTCSS